MNNHKAYLLGSILLLIIIGIFSFGIVTARNDRPLNTLVQSTENNSLPTEIPVQEAGSLLVEEGPALTPNITHITTPDSVRAWYMSAWVASTPSIRNKMITLMDDTEINAVVIDIKDATGRISFQIDDPIINELGASRNLIKDLPEFIAELHEKNIYVIGRISVFQDSFIAEKKPDWALKSISTGTPWKDKKGLSFLDPTHPEVWNYITAIAQGSYDKGFDEINFDYIRFPSDGNISDIRYPDISISKSDAIEQFFIHIDSTVRKDNIPTSADLFGLVTNTSDDMGIGQVLEKALPYFDYISPMIYPSHYPKNFHGFSNPASYPYEIITIAMEQGIQRAVAAGYSPQKFRPWIQDFNLGDVYTAPMVKEQISALTDLGITSYMAWDPSNTYTKDAYRTGEI